MAYAFDRTIKVGDLTLQNFLFQIPGITDYINGIQYTNGEIDFIQTEEGIARKNGTAYSYEYNLTDHLGNVRATFYQNPNNQQIEVLQRDDYSQLVICFIGAHELSRREVGIGYYAFGLRKMGSPNSNTNKYLYNGKELQEELGEYDYGARFYDPVVGRWNSVDPMAESYQSFSPFNYVENNPVSNTDPDGRSTEGYATRYITPGGRTIINTNDGRNDVYMVPWERLREFEQNAYWSDRPGTGQAHSVGWNNYWRDQFQQVMSETEVEKAGINALSDEKVKSAAFEYLFGNRSYESFVWEEVKGQWRNPGNVAMGLTAFGHGMVGVLQPKPTFGTSVEGQSHAIRHIEAAGLNVEKVKAVIARDLKPVSSYRTGVRITGTVVVDNVTINYSGTKLPNGKINIGSIKPPR